MIKRGSPLPTLERLVRPTRFERVAFTFGELGASGHSRHDCRAAIERRRVFAVSFGAV